MAIVVSDRPNSGGSQTKSSQLLKTEQMINQPDPPFFTNELLDNWPTQYALSNLWAGEFSAHSVPW
ncbi:hypothetical protein ACYCVF_31935 [Bradyrhizobium sp. 1.29L]